MDPKPEPNARLTDIQDYTFVAGSMMLGISIGLNAVSMHGTCTAVFVAVAAMVGGSFASIRTLGRMSWLALVGVTSLVIASKRCTSYCDF